MAMADFRIHGLYAITPDEADTVRLTELVAAAVEGGARLVQYRNKTASPDLRATQAASLVRVCRAAGIPLLINDHPDIATTLGADGVHLGEDDGDVAAARARIPGGLLGVSCYNEVRRAIEAERQGADYVAFGRFFASTTKPGIIRASLALVAEAKRAVKLPLVAIGGITLDNAPGLIAGGIDAIAVISALFAARDVRATARRFSALFTEERE